MATHARKIPLITVLLVTLILLGCASRYRMDLFQTADEVSRKVKVEKTQYLPGARLTAPTAEEKITRGDGNVVILTTGTRGTRTPSGLYTVLSYDEYLRCDIYLQLPPALTLRSVPLKGNSFLWVLGRYDQQPDSRLFLPDSGEVAIDSLTHTYLYGTVHGVYENGDGIPLGFDGRFKVKIRK